MGYAEDMRAFMALCDTRPLNHTERLLWYRIRWMFDKAGDPRRLAIRTGYLAAMEGVSRDTLERARRALVREGLLRHTARRGRGDAPEYEMLPIIRGNAEENAAFDAAGYAEENAAFDAAEGDAYAGAREESNNNIINNPKPLEKKGVRGKRDRGEHREELFDRFWTAYPRKVGKKPCAEAWKRLRMTDELFGRIMAGLQRDARSVQWTKDGGQYIPHPATWLRQARWEDETQTPAEMPQQSGDGVIKIDGRQYY